MRWLILSLFLIGVAGVAVMPSPLMADSCVVRNHAVYQQAVVSPYVGYNANVVNSYGYHQTYYPKVVEVVVNNDYYYSVADYYKLKLLSDSIVGRILEAQAKGQGGVQPTNPPQGGIVPPTVPVTPTGTGPVKAGPFQDEKLVAVVNQSCASCHSGNSPKGGFTIVTEDGKLADLDICAVGKVFHQCATGRMPKGGKPLPDDVMPLLDQWVTEVSKQAKK